MRKLFNISLAALLFTAFAPVCLHAADKAETPLGEQMDKMKTEMRALRSALEAPVDADKDKYVKMASRFRAAAVASKKFDPAKTETLAEDKRAEFVAEYHAAMNKLVKTTDNLKKQLAAGDWDAARAQLKALAQEQREGHKQFRVKKD